MSAQHLIVKSVSRQLVTKTLESLGENAIVRCHIADLDVAAYGDRHVG